MFTLHRLWNTTSYICIGQESESVPRYVSGNVNEPLLHLHQVRKVQGRTDDTSVNLQTCAEQVPSIHAPATAPIENNVNAENLLSI